MSSLLTSILSLCAGLFALLVMIEFAMRKRLKACLLQFSLLAVFLFALRLTTGFPVPSERLPFGDASLLAAIGIMFVATVLGIAARYIFYLQMPFSWLGLLKPMCVTPLVLLPLIGSIQALSSISNTQLVSFAFLAFQNGFFWQMVLEAARPNLTAGPAIAAESKVGQGR